MASKSKNVSVSKKTLKKQIYEYRWIYVLGIPGVIVLFMFSYMPLRGLLMAFQDYNPHLGILESPWVGLKHFKTLFQDAKFYNMLKNTLIISGLNLLTFPAPIILALIMNEVRNAKFKKFIQTSVYLPHFLSWAIVASLTFFLLSTEQGLVNKIAEFMGHESTAYLFSSKWIYLIIVIQSLWKSVGWGSIVYLAAISGIDQSLYEAAKMDGANRFQCMLKITLPSIMPTVAVMLILRMGSIISVDFEQVFLMNNAMVKSQLEVFEVYIYNNSIGAGSTQYSYTTAIGLFKSVINTGLVIFTNWITSRKGYEGVM
ncbi:ABC transporter permease [Murimonas intestini]|uniref:Carbohydrate ABC transporter membrane protein 1 (CUT1 family) n=1 Tax=Murimonas intestini TaxID=1337051 RepID=A0AB73SXW1_9FIRM|nr:ABC transporter permease subunit [Murimonas intestini]MCR1843342.1 ABC transporter permease subunit [Murimonas intestini]MCR1865707.1 ABC transporter permease subunit [Murimonas intestini]MCR1886174.1 ABC transporter permease subunit [Murimonas intestini]